jgi:hypothetical protein
MITTLLIVHGLLAVALLGALTHQALAVCWPSRHPAGFVSRVRAVSGPAYTNAVIILFIVTFVLGAVIYPAYRLNVRTYLQDYRMYPAEGAFEIKEHLAAIALALLPLYWFLWRRFAAEPVGAAVVETAAVVGQAHGVARAAVTLMLALTVWFNFLIGHILNNIRGLFGA